MVREAHYAYCDNPGVCAVCEQTFTDGILIHIEDWSTKFYNAEYHWHACYCRMRNFHAATHYASCDNPAVCAECGISYSGQDIRHVYEGYSLRDDDTYHWQICIHCGQELMQPHAAYCYAPNVCYLCGQDYAGNNIVHNALYSDLFYDETCHWTECEDCGQRIYQAEHTFNEEGCIFCGFSNDEYKVVDCGKCWENRYWTLDSTGVLRITSNAPREAREKQWDADAVRRVIIGPGIENIPASAFMGLKNLASAWVREGTTSIGSHAFSNTPLAEVFLPESLETLEFGVFFRCAHLVKISIPDKVETIYNETFFGCSSLENIILPVSLKQVISYAFQESDNLANVYYEGSEAGWKAIIIAESGNAPLLNARVHFARTDFTVTFDTNNPNNQYTDVQHSENGQLVIGEEYPLYRPYITADGPEISHECLGWALNADAEEPDYVAGDALTLDKDTTLYAVWQKKQITISFDPLGGSMNEPTVMTVPWGETIILPKPTRPGYRFGGWQYPNIGGNWNVEGDTLTVNRTRSYTALWMEVSDLNLPLDTKTVEAEAFAGLSVRSVTIPPAVTSIGSRAFADNEQLTDVWIYGLFVDAAGDAFEGCPNVTLHWEAAD